MTLEEKHKIQLIGGITVMCYMLSGCHNEEIKKNLKLPSSLAKYLYTRRAYRCTALCSLPSTLTAEIPMTRDIVLCLITYFVFQIDIYNKCVSDICDSQKEEDDLLVILRLLDRASS